MGFEGLVIPPGLCLLDGRGLLFGVLEGARPLENEKFSSVYVTENLVRL